MSRPRAHDVRPYKEGCRCAAVLRGCCCLPRPGGAVGAAISRPWAHDVRPYERRGRCAAVLRGFCCLPRLGGAVGAAISRPWAHDVRPCKRDAAPHMEKGRRM